MLAAVALPNTIVARHLNKFFAMNQVLLFVTNAAGVNPPFSQNTKTDIFSMTSANVNTLLQHHGPCSSRVFTLADVIEKISVLVF